MSARAPSTCTMLAEIGPSDIPAKFRMEKRKSISRGMKKTQQMLNFPKKMKRKKPSSRQKRKKLNCRLKPRTQRCQLKRKKLQNRRQSKKTPYRHRNRQRSNRLKRNTLLNFLLLKFLIHKIVMKQRKFSKWVNWKSQ